MYKILYLPTAQIVRWNGGYENNRHTSFIGKDNAIKWLETENCYLMNAGNAEIPFFLEAGLIWKYARLGTVIVSKHLLEVIEVIE